jgi:hypothetical protein
MIISTEEFKSMYDNKVNSFMILDCRLSLEAYFKCNVRRSKFFAQNDDSVISYELNKYVDRDLSVNEILLYDNASETFNQLNDDIKNFVSIAQTKNIICIIVAGGFLRICSEYPEVCDLYCENGGKRLVQFSDIFRVKDLDGKRSNRDPSKFLVDFSSDK